ncbi:uroporphyrinogen-III synthase [Methylophilaceae bacterium]|nr:uroporphyrinogen-III synthase [Methylophilaceae bacterium]
MSPLAGKSIVITRPPEQAKKLSALVSAEGATPLLFPLIVIAPLDDYQAFEARLNELADCDRIIFISSNAVQHGMPRLLAKLGSIPDKPQFAAIGPVTAAELEKFGVRNILMPAGRFDSEALLALPEMQSVAGKKIMIVRGVGGRELMADTLDARGARVDFAECYQRLNPQKDAGFLQGLWQNGQLDAMVVTSSEAMRHLLDLARDDLMKEKPLSWIKNTVLCVNHERIAQLPRANGIRVAVAGEPGDEAMLQCLSEALESPQS